MKPLDIFALRSMSILLTNLFLIMLLSYAAQAQIASNGTYKLEQAVIGSGGGTGSGGAGDIYTIEGTIGQPAAGIISSGGGYAVRGGFWTGLVAPTAATVSVGGRVTVEGASGKGILNVTVSVTDSSGATRTTLTGAGGKYRFDDLEAGQLYIFAVSAKRYTFAAPTIVHSATENFDGINFVGTSQF